MSKNGHNGHNAPGHVTETPDVSHIKNVDVTHEASDVSVGGILKFVLGLAIFGIVVHLLMLGIFRFFDAQEKTTEPQGPMAMTKEERLPPEPRLQAAPGFEVKLANGEKVKLEKSPPEAEYRVLLEQWQRQLNCEFGDEKLMAHGVIATRPACLPIDKAMDALFEGEGLPVRAKERDSGNTTEIALPTAASSGRVAGMK